MDMVDVNEQAREGWKAGTSTLERVRSVIETTYEGQTAGEIADRALVAETTARGHLEDLAEGGYVEKTAEPDRNATLYQRSTSSLIFEQANDIRAHADREEILEQVTEMRARLEEFRDRTGMDTPEDVAWSESSLDRETVQEWETTRRNLEFAKVALAIGRAENIVQDRNAV